MVVVDNYAVVNLPGQVPSAMLDTIGKGVSQCGDAHVRIGVTRVDAGARSPAAAADQAYVDRFINAVVHSGGHSQVTGKRGSGNGGCCSGNKLASRRR